MVFIVLRPSTQIQPSSAGQQGISEPAAAAQSVPTRETAHAKDGSTQATAPEAQSPQALAEYIRRFAASGGDANELYRKLATLRLQEQPWWRSGDGVSALLDLALEPRLGEDHRVIAVGLYLSAAPRAQIHANSATVQHLAIESTDKMASAVLQGMADRSVAPAALIKEILTSEARGTGAKCYAWYAARLTQKSVPEFADVALASSESGMTEASKVAFDYLANGSFSGQYVENSEFRQKTDALITAVQSLPPDADPIGLANGDAFIRALPHITPTDAAINSLFSLVQEAQNSEMRLSAIEQLVAIHLSGAQDLSQELHEVRNSISTLFSDPVKQDRAKLRLNRIQTQGKSK